MRKRLRPAEWATALAALDALFLAFVAVQITVLFGGRDHILRTAGLTYAEYARSGFAQLVAVTVLTLAVLVAAAVCARTAGRRDRILLASLLALLAVLAGVVVASALRRLDLYVDAYGLTRLRHGIWFVELGLGALLAAALLGGLVPRARRSVARATVLAAAAGIVVFSAANPDATVAGRNVERWRETGRVDTDYLASLSADAVPRLAALPEPLRSRVLGPIAERLGPSEPWSSWNLARARARETLRGLDGAPLDAVK